MSLILEALNKADRERDNQPIVPDLQTVHGRITPPVPPKRHWGVYAIIALLILILFLLVAVLVRQTIAPTPNPSAVAPSTPAAPAPPAAAQPALPPAAAIANDLNSEVHDIYQDANTEAPLPEYNPSYDDSPAPVRGKKSRSRLLEELESQAQTLDNESNNEDEEPLPASVRKITKAPKASDSMQDAADLKQENIQELWEQTKKEVPDRPSNKTERLDTQIKEAIKDSLSLYKQIPFLHELPERAQNSVPSINYVNHLYSEKAGGVVIINKKTLRAGQEISPGMLIERVASDGIIVQYQGMRFRLNALSSWVNFSNKTPAADTSKK